MDHRLSQVASSSFLRVLLLCLVVLNNQGYVKINIVRCGNSIEQARLEMNGEYRLCTVWEFHRGRVIGIVF